MTVMSARSEAEAWALKVRLALLMERWARGEDVAEDAGVLFDAASELLDREETLAWSSKCDVERVYYTAFDFAKPHPKEPVFREWNGHIFNRTMSAGLPGLGKRRK